MQQDLLVFTAPPAFGKTYLISQLIGCYSYKILVISPLRALRDECLRKWGETVWVMTPEEWLFKKPQSPVVIFDEFHLMYYWGDTFRPMMWEAFYGSHEAQLTILLTATMKSEMREQILSFKNHYDQILWVNYGNQELKNKPHDYLKFSHKRDLEQHILLGPAANVTLIFCQYRSEVFAWVKKLEDQRHRVWGCVGGEASVFSEKVSREHPPEFIVATTVLSHGINLPRIGRIYFTYKVQNIDFWIQMVARGGRRGEKFMVYSLEAPHGISWRAWKNFFLLQKEKIRIEIQLMQKQIEQWFLKE
jgi:superfamily II DNA helicase RecQ